MVLTKQTKIISYASICFVSRTGLWGVAIDRLLKICIQKIKLLYSEGVRRRSNINELNEIRWQWYVSTSSLFMFPHFVPYGSDTHCCPMLPVSPIHHHSQNNVQLNFTTDFCGNSQKLLNTILEPWELTLRKCHNHIAKLLMNFH